MATITIKIMTHDRSRCAEVTLPDSLTVASLVFQCQKRWQLDHNEIFAVRDLSRNNRLEETDSLSTAGVRSGTELQIFPLVEGGAPMTSVRQRRLQSDYERLNALVAAQSMLSIESARGNPPETYVIVFRRRSIAELRGNVPVFCGRQRMKIEMPTDYPAVPPLVTVLAPMFHPHVWPRTNIVCLGPWNITESLDTLVLRLDSLLRYDPARLNWKSVANQEAADWAVRNQDLFPLDQSEKNLSAVSRNGDPWFETA